MNRFYTILLLAITSSVSFGQNTGWSEDSLLQYWVHNGTDAHEGIYQNVLEEAGSPKYRLALKSTSADTYTLIYLSGAATADAERWNTGDVKAYLSSSDANSYKVKWYMGDKSTSKDLSISFDEKYMQVNWNNDRPVVLYEKIFPENPIRIIKATEVKIAEPVYDPTMVNAFLISAKGYLLTQNNMLGASDEVIVTNALSGEKYTATITDRNIETNLALVRVDDPSFILPDTLPYNFIRSNLSIGDNVYCIGFNTGDTSTIKKAHLQNAIIVASTNNRYILSPQINPWCNGSPVFDRQGNLTGLLSTDKATAGSSVIPTTAISAVLQKNNISLEQKVLSDVNMKTQSAQMEILLPIIFIIDPAEVR